MATPKLDRSKQADRLVRKIVRASISSDRALDIDAAVETVAKELPEISRTELSAMIVTAARLVGQNIIWKSKN